MRLTKASRFGLYALVDMALRPGERVSAGSIAGRFGISENHIAKVLQQLVRGGLINSTRGVGGGYTMAKPPSQVTMADVVSCIEGPFATDDCGDCPFRKDHGECAVDVATCSVHKLLNELSVHVYYTLASVTIATLAKSRGSHVI